MILVVAVFNIKQALAKPHNPQELGDGTEYRFPTANITTNQHVEKAAPRQNGDGMEGFWRNFCSDEKGLRDRTMQSSCETGRYWCQGYVETVCKNLSLACIRGLDQYHPPLCVPLYEWVTIVLGAEGQRRVRRTKACSCA